MVHVGVNVFNGSVLTARDSSFIDSKVICVASSKADISDCVFRGAFEGDSTFRRAQNSIDSIDIMGMTGGSGVLREACRDISIDIMNDWWVLRVKRSSCRDILIDIMRITGGSLVKRLVLKYLDRYHGNDRWVSR